MTSPKSRSLYLFETIFLLVASHSLIFIISLMTKAQLPREVIILTGMALFPILYEYGPGKTPPREAGFSIPSPISEECAVLIILTLITITYAFILGGAKPHFDPCDIFSAFLIAISEETLYRGILTRRLSQLWGDIAGAIVASLLFAFAAHPGATFLSNITWRFPLSLIMSYLYLRKRSLFSPIALHLLINVIYG